MNPNTVTTEPSPGPSTAGGGSNTTPRRLNTANAATQNPQAGTRFISSCNRCRRRKIKCDAGIPSCHACTESGTTCEYHDTTTNTDLPRARIIGLEQHLMHLLEQQAQLSQQSPQHTSTISVDGTVQPEFRGRLVVSGIRLACTFCRKRKIKCDGAAPCAGCNKFGRPTECSILYEEASSQGRSYISYLEDRICKCEREMSGPGHQYQQQIYDSRYPQPPGGHGLQSASYGGPDASQHGETAFHQMPVSTEPEEPARALQGELSENVKGVLHELNNLTDRSPAVLTNPNMHTPWTFRVSLSSLSGFHDETGPFKTMPARAMVQPLIQHYVTEIFPAYPLIYLPDLHRAAEAFYINQASSFQQFLVLIVTAIAASHMSEHPSSVAAWNALKFFSTAINAAAFNSDSLEGLQCNILIIQFSTLNPSKMNAWYLSGVTMRVSTNLGLHKELTDAELQTESQLHFPTGGSESYERPSSRRRRLFWSAYMYDRVLSMTTGRPCGFEDAVISVGLPDMISKELSPGDITLQRVQICRIQSELYNKLYHSGQGHVMSNEECSKLVDTTEGRIAEWETSIRSCNTSDNLQTLLEVELPHTRMLLYRPSPAMPKRSTEDTLKLIHVAVELVDQFWTFMHETPTTYFSTFMISRLYTAGIALMYGFSLAHPDNTEPNWRVRSQTIQALAKATTCLFSLTERWQVGADLASRFVSLHAAFIDSTSVPGVQAVDLPEIREFSEHRLGALQKNVSQGRADWAAAMRHLLLVEPDAQQTSPRSANTPANGQTPVYGLSQAGSEDRDSQRALQMQQTELRRASSQSQQQQPTSSGQSMPQSSPYGQASSYSMSGSSQQSPYNYQMQSLHSNQPYANHLPHRPTLQGNSQRSQGQIHTQQYQDQQQQPQQAQHQQQSPHALPVLTPLQQLAATAVDLPGQLDQKHHPQ